MNAPPAAPGELFEQRVEAFLDGIATGAGSAGGGATAAFVVGLAAALVGMAVRSSGDQWAGAPGAIVQADALRSRAAPLARADAAAYARALDTLRRRATLDPQSREETIREALGHAADVPLLITEAACDIVALAAHVAESGSDEVRGDAAAAAALADGAARAAANLVQINLATTPDDERLARARRLLEESAGQVRRALGESR